MVNPTPIVWWGLETNCKGQIQKLVGENGNYKMILVVRYGPGGDNYSKEGKYYRMQIVVYPTEKKTVIMEERVYRW